MLHRGGQIWVVMNGGTIELIDKVVVEAEWGEK